MIDDFKRTAVYGTGPKTVEMTTAMAYEAGIAKGRADALREALAVVEKHWANCERTYQQDGWHEATKEQKYALETGAVMCVKMDIEALAQKPQPMPTPTYEKGLSDLYQGPIDSGKTYLAERSCGNCAIGQKMDSDCERCCHNPKPTLDDYWQPKEGA